MEGQSLKFPKIPAKLCLNGRAWTQFDRITFWNFPEFRKKAISPAILDNIGLKILKQVLD